MLITIIAGARPNFMKIAPIISAIKEKQKLNVDIRFRLIHTGQHYDKKMSSDFFEQLDIPLPDNNLESGSGTAAEQTASIMIRFEKELKEYPSDLVLVVGDVTSTMACAIVAQKMHIKVAHVEAGIRSGDWSMPEEINRLVTDSITNYFFTTSELAGQNLTKAGIESTRIFFVGNTMIDTLLKQIPHFIRPEIWDKFDLIEKEYGVLTLHRPGNVDQEGKLRELIESIVKSSKNIPFIFPVHPRTANSLKNIGIDFANIHLVDPLSYLEFNYLVKHSKLVITDSGGITEETTVMGIPCMTLRDTTERPETCEIGTNELLGTNPLSVGPAFEKLYSGHWKKGRIPKFWDGKTSERIVDQILNIFS